MIYETFEPCAIDYNNTQVRWRWPRILHTLHWLSVAYSNLPTAGGPHTFNCYLVDRDFKAWSQRKQALCQPHFSCCAWRQKVSGIFTFFAFCPILKCFEYTKVQPNPKIWCNISKNQNKSKLEQMEKKKNVFQENTKIERQCLGNNKEFYHLNLHLLQISLNFTLEVVY